jgi:hypothetical protein
MKNNLICSLSLKSKKSLYKPFFFYTISSFLPKGPSNFNKKCLSFKAAILSQFSIANELDQQRFLIRAQVLSNNNSFLYLDLGKKYTLIKPKFKSVFTNLVSKEFLFVSQKIFIKSLKVLETNRLLKVFSFTSFKVSKFTYSERIGESGGFFLNKLIYFPVKYSYKFFFFKESIGLFSNFQKKINFFQFNVLFKKYKYI